MAALKDLMGAIEYKVIQGTMDTEIFSIAYDSRKCDQNSLFVCIPGQKQDGHNYISQAISNGASAIFVQEMIWETKGFDLGNCENKSLTVVVIKDTRSVLAQISSIFFKNPSKRLKLLGVTGTKGKTTSTYMFREIFSCAGKSAGLIGTVANYAGGEKSHAEHTTPESYDLQQLLAKMVEKKDEACVMEVSSLGLKYDRIGACSFFAGVFTNLYPDHISEEEHADMKEYFSWKLHLFDMTENAIINGDIPECDEVLKKADAAGNRIYKFGFSEKCEVKASSLKKIKKGSEIGTSFHLESPWYQGEIFVGMPSVFNVYNALAAICLAGVCGISFEAVCKGLASVRVPGRLQSVPNDRNISVVVDYAHNAASLEQLLTSLREYAQGRLITVFGCGGNRPKSRRYEMGEVSGRLSDLTVVTSDNPRDEEPGSIIENILEGLTPTGGKCLVEENRRAAIELAISNAHAGDMVVVAGKGHEDYQIIGDKTTWFDDFCVIEEIFKEQKNGTYVE